MINKSSNLTKNYFNKQVKARKNGFIRYYLLIKTNYFLLNATKNIRKEA